MTVFMLQALLAIIFPAVGVILFCEQRLRLEGERYANGLMVHIWTLRVSQRRVASGWNEGFDAGLIAAIELAKLPEEETKDALERIRTERNPYR